MFFWVVLTALSAKPDSSSSASSSSSNGGGNTAVPSPTPTPRPTPFQPYVPRLRTTTPIDNAQAVSKELKTLVLTFDDATPVRKGDTEALLLIEQFDTGAHGSEEAHWRPFLNVSINSSRVALSSGNHAVTVALDGLGEDAHGDVAKSPFRWATYYQVRVGRGALRALDDADAGRGTAWGGIGGEVEAEDEQGDGGGVQRRWTFKVEPEPTIEADALTQNSTLAAHRVQMWGVGVFVLDVGAVDLKAGTFYADLQV